MTGEISQSNQDPPYHLSAQYSARVQDGQQEMERNEATAKHVVWPSCAWLLLRFFPYPVGQPEHEHCRERNFCSNTVVSKMSVFSKPLKLKIVLNHETDEKAQRPACVLSEILKHS